MAAHAYIGSFTKAGGLGITAARVEAGTGALTVLGHTADVPDPSFLTASADGRHLYTVSETSPEGAAAAFSLAEPAAPRLLGEPVPVHGADPTHLALHHGHLATANYSAPAGVTVLPVRPDGGLGEPTCVLLHEGSGPDTGRQEGPHAHAVLPDPSGRWLLSADLGTDSVRVCELDPETGELEIERELGLRSGTGPRHLTFHPGGGLLYVTNELDSVVTVCRFDPATGSLRPLDEVRLLPEGASGENFPAELVVAPGARFAWAANRGHDSISVLTVSEDGERLGLVDSVDCGGSWPRHLTLDPSGTRLYAANERSGTVAWFDVDPGSGTPKQSGALELPAVSCVLFV